MMNLDPRSIILLSGLMALVMSMVLFSLRRNYPSSIRGLTEWALAPLLIFVSTLLFGARGAISDLLSIVAANLILLAGLVLLYFGSQRFFDQPKSTRLWGTLIFAAAAFMVWTYVEPHYGHRVLMMAFLMSLLSFSHLRLLLSRGARGFATYLTVAALLIQTVAQAYRFFEAFSAPADDALLLLSLSQTVVVTTYAVCILMVTIGTVLMATDRLRTEFEHLASHDSLTGALTRRAMIEACEQELERTKRRPRVMALLMMDMDHFKAVNDAYGHPGGDRVLRGFAARVTALLRRPDRFGRFGGEEFVALLPETSLEEAELVAERIRAETERGEPGLPACTVSIGVAGSRSDDATLDSMLARADTALYQAKADGRNCVRTQN
ncbi:MAG: GGDEF domain-containing protein [Burkholderiaceae bacterium]|nr:GGDEF domain-containing protein [Sulfuritalea sp.]MCF8175326.1 GGDEF domain-containing protein [Burkholderiaceae bacterium]